MDFRRASGISSAPSAAPTLSASAEHADDASQVASSSNLDPPASLTTTIKSVEQTETSTVIGGRGNTSNTDPCGICLEPLKDKCTDCQVLEEPLHNRECIWAAGTCTHVFHQMCIEHWCNEPQSRGECPMCKGRWETKYLGGMPVFGPQNIERPTEGVRNEMRPGPTFGFPQDLASIILGEPANAFQGAAHELLRLGAIWTRTHQHEMEPWQVAEQLDWASWTIERLGHFDRDEFNRWHFNTEEMWTRYVRESRERREAMARGVQPPPPRDRPGVVRDNGVAWSGMRERIHEYGPRGREWWREGRLLRRTIRRGERQQLIRLHYLMWLRARAEMRAAAGVGWATHREETVGEWLDRFRIEATAMQLALD